jgi:hypothetical protein
LRDVVDIFRSLSAGDQRDTFRALNGGQQLRFVAYTLTHTDAGTWHVIAETATTETRTYVVRSLMRTGKMSDADPPWGAYGFLNGLSSSDQTAVVSQLSDKEQLRLQQGLASAAGVDRQRLEQSMAAVAPGGARERQISFPLTWVADEVAPGAVRGIAGLGPSFYMASQGAHAVAPTGAMSGMRMIGTGYWRALVPARRAIELQRVLNQLPRDLDPWLTTHLANTPPGQQPSFQWINQPVGAMDRPFTVQELQTIPDIVRRFNVDRASVSPAELALLRRAASLHVGGAQSGGSPLVSWSTPSRPGQPEPTTWAGQRQFKVRAEFDPNDVLNNMQASEANTLTPEEAARGFEPPLNPDEAEYLAVAGRDASVVTVEPLGAAVKGELVAGSTAWMARNATQLRWAGRGLIVVSFAISGYRIATATEAERPRVIGQEVGAQALGWGGAVLAGAACVAFGIATGGVGLFLCGLAGGILGGMAGSALGGAFVDALGRPTSAPSDPFGLFNPQMGLGTGLDQQALLSPMTGDVLVVPAEPPEMLIY